MGMSAIEDKCMSNASNFVIKTREKLDACLVVK